MKKEKENLPTRKPSGGGVLSKVKALDGKKKIYLGVLVISLITLIAGVSFAYISYTAKQTSTNTIGTSCVKVTLSDVTKPISLDKAYPLKDSEAEQLTPYTFKIENNCDTPVTYKVDLDVLNTDKPTPLSDLAIQVDNNTKRILNILDNSDNLIENAYVAKEILGSGVLNVGSSIEHSIKIWLDETATNDSQNTTHNSKVVVTATQDTSLEVKDVMSSFMNETVYLTYKTFGSVDNVSCKYGLTEDNLDQNGTNITKTSCELNPTNPNTTYYYEVCLTTKNGVNKCIKDRVDTRIEEITTEPVLNTDNIEIPITTTGNNITCKYSTDENVYTTEGIIEGNICKITPIEQGKTYYYQICSTNELGNTGCITGHQATEVPIITIGNVTSTDTTITIPYTTTGTEVTVECKYGTSANDLNSNGTVSGNTCTLSGLDSNTTYYYELIATNKYLVPTSANGNKATYSAFYTNANLGDYVAYTPNKTSYTISGTSTGCTSSSTCGGASSNGSQTINPSELNLWRVIKKNDDGTLEIISEYTSSNYIIFYGKEGYRRFVGTLNEIASAYETSGITVDSHHMGYDGEQATCSSYTSCSDQKTGSNGYLTLSEDIRLVNKAYGGSETCTSSCESLKSYKSNATTSAAYYHLASRLYSGSRYNNRFVDTDGSLVSSNLVYSGGSGGFDARGVRPVVTLKSGLTATEGSKNDKKLWTVN